MQNMARGAVVHMATAASSAAALRNARCAYLCQTSCLLDRCLSRQKYPRTELPPLRKVSGGRAGGAASKATAETKATLTAPAQGRGSRTGHGAAERRRRRARAVRAVRAVRTARRRRVAGAEGRVRQDRARQR